MSEGTTTQAEPSKPAAKATKTRAPRKPRAPKPVTQFDTLKGKRVRVHFANRKMSIPGEIQIQSGVPVLHTRWDKNYPLLDQPVTQVDVMDDKGRFQSQPAA
jgi:hypothetical protein